VAHDIAPVETPQEPVEVDEPGRRPAIWLIAAAGVLALLIRLPFVFTGLSTDEGGYAYVAQLWSRGQKLYDTAWLDRPQGLLLTYRVLLWVNDSGWTIRVGMMLAGALISVFLGVIGWQLSGGGRTGQRVGVSAAFLYAIIGVAPHLEGMTLNGELLASVPASASVAAILLWRRSCHRSYQTSDQPRRLNRQSVSIIWLLSAGLLAGIAMTMKQSGIDGVLVGLAVLLLAERPKVRRTLAFLGAFALPIVACVLHGWSLGLSRYWNALAGYQFSAMGGAASNSGTRWHDFTHYLGGIAIDLTIVVIVACFGFRALNRTGRVVVITWLAAGFIGVNLGGSYWPHYYMQPLPPLVLLAAVAVTAFTHPGVRAAVAALLVLPTLIWLAALIPMSPQHRARTIPYDALAVRDRHIAHVIDAQTTADQRIYVLESEAYLYFLAHRQASYPYLWGMPIQKIPSAVPLLRTMLEATDRPTLIVMDTPDPDTVDPTGGIRRDLATYYHADGVVDGVAILRAN
jgi:hypothetical protein